MPNGCYWLPGNDSVTIPSRLLHLSNQNHSKDFYSIQELRRSCLNMARPIQTVVPYQIGTYYPFAWHCN